MTFKTLTILPLLFVTFFVKAQTSQLRINQNIILPKDSTERKQLISSLNDFLSAAQKPNEENKLVFAAEAIETFMLLDEIKEIEKSGKFKDDFFYKPYLTNAIPLKNNQYLLQISFIGVNENTAFLKANFEFIAHKTGDTFFFSSPLVSNTKTWKVEKSGNTIFHYQASINKAKIKAFNTLTAIYDKKLGVKNKITEFYCCENLSELQKLIGVGYKSDYNSKSEGIWSASLGDKKIIALGNDNASFNDFDPHDLWHDRLSLVIPRNQVNKAVDEGCAYIYGGSWGLSWKTIFEAFKEQVASNKNTNWIEVKEKPLYFKTQKFPNVADQIVNALLVKKIEKEKGFAGVWELLNCGKVEKGNENYYKALEKITGITKTDYNEKVWELINKEI